VSTPAIIHIICIHWGTAYAADDINHLYSMVRRNTSLPIQFHLFSNQPPTGLSAEIDVHPEPGLNVSPEWNRHNYVMTTSLALLGNECFFSTSM
jgi:hypothetical protein